MSDYMNVDYMVIWLPDGGHKVYDVTGGKMEITSSRGEVLLSKSGLLQAKAHVHHGCVTYRIEWDHGWSATWTFGGTFKIEWSLV